MSGSLEAFQQGVFADRFDVRRSLGTGGFGDVFEVWDKARQGMVAAKVLHQRNPTSLMRFKNEFRSLARISHPSLVQLYELLSDGDTWMFTMELVQGTNFMSHIRGRDLEDTYSWTKEFQSVTFDSITLEETMEHETLPRAKSAFDVSLDFHEDRLRSALRQLAEGIHALHESGKLHRDLKPPNVLVDDNGRVVILDFGMVSELTPNSRAAVQNAPRGSVPILGTPLYMSPEQGGSGEIKEASDWYSFGVMLFESLTGRYPVTGDNIVQLLLRKHNNPPTLEDFGPEVPADLRDLAIELLRPDPNERPAGREILHRLGVGLANAYSDERANFADSPIFVGRADSLETLERAFFDVRHGQRPRVVQVSGHSGMGKTCLVNEFLDRVADRATILNGRCYENETVPYKAVDGVIDRLSERLRDESSKSPIQHLNEDFGALIRVFPVLLRVPLIRDQINEDQAKSSNFNLVRMRAIQALRAILRVLGDEHEIVLFIDDVQWGDQDSARLLAEIFRPPNAPKFLLITTHRIDDAADSPFLIALIEGVTEHQVAQSIIEIGEFGDTDACQLVHSLLGELSTKSVVAAIVAESKGSPFFIDALTRHPNSGLGISALEDVIQRQIEMLPEPARKMLEVVAVAGQPLERGIVRSAALVENEAPKALAHLRNARLVQVKNRRDEEWIETYHDRIRETIRDRLSVEAKRSHHNRIGELLEDRIEIDNERLAFHFKQAGENNKAGRYALAAADQSMDALAFGRAAELLEDALKLDPTWSVGERREIFVKLGKMYGYLARGGEAANAYLQAAESVDDIDRVELQGKAAEQLIRSGQIERGRAMLDDVLSQVGVKTPQSEFELISGLVWNRLRLLVRGTTFEISTTELSLPEQVQLDTLWSAANLMATIDVRFGGYFQLLNILKALDSGDGERTARALAMQAVHESVGPRTRPKAALIIKDVRSICEVAELSKFTKAWIQFCVGMVDYMSGDFRKSHREMTESALLLREETSGSIWEIATVEFYDLFNMFPLGKFRTISERIPLMLQEAEAANDFMHTIAVRLWGYIASLIRDEPEAALVDTELAIESWTNDGFHLQHFWHFLATGNTFLYMGNSEAAYEAIEGRWKALQRSMLLTTQVAHVFALELRIRACIGMAATSSDPRSKKKFAKQAEKHVRKLVAFKAVWTQGICSLMSAEIAVVRGEKAKALELLGIADVQLTNSDLRFWALASRRRLGQLLSGDRGAAIIQEVETILSREGVVRPDRMCDMVTTSNLNSPSLLSEA